MSDKSEIEDFFATAHADAYPKIRDSSMTITIAPGEPDPKSAIELGYTLLLNKPLIIVAPEDRDVPGRLARAADFVIYMKDADYKEQLLEAMRRLGVIEK